MQNISDIRKQILTKYKNNDFVIDKTGCKTIELIGATFLVDEDYIIRKTNQDYFERELTWYKSQSLNVNDIPPPVPAIWKQVGSKTGERPGQINSNYGWCIWSEENGNQYKHVLTELKLNPDSRRASMIYNRPTMHTDFNKDGMSDFMCTFAQQFFIRNNKLVMHVLMRSNDFCYGFQNDGPFFKYVQSQLASDLQIEIGDYIHTASSAHVYERHFKHLDELIEKES